MKSNYSLIFFLLAVFSLLQGHNQNPEEFVKKYIHTSMETDDTFQKSILIVDDDQFYIFDARTGRTYIYAKKDGKKIREFGNKGEGPGEIKGIIRHATVSNDKILITSESRLSIFTKEGKFLKEYPTSSYYYSFQPLGHLYISLVYDYNQANQGIVSNIFSLHNPDLKKIKAIFSTQYPLPKPDNKQKVIEVFFPHRRKGIIYKNKFYAGCTDKGFFIRVFDRDGNQLYDIDKKYDKIKITGEIQDKILKQVKKSMTYDEYKEYDLRREPFFPDYIPAFLNFFIDRDNIYVFHYFKPGSQGWMELTVLDMEGNERIRKDIMLGGYFIILEMDDYVSFSNGKLHFLCPQEESTKIIELDVEELVKR